MKLILLTSIIICIEIYRNCGAIECDDNNCKDQNNNQNCAEDCESNEYYNVCETRYCCYKLCYRKCTNIPCRHSCKNSCHKQIAKTEPKDSKTTFIYSNTSLPVHNITTIINLRSVINASNTINLPNFENLSIPIQQNNCCQIIGPKQCEPSVENGSSNDNCFYNSSVQCGNFCRAPVMHVEKYNSCLTYPLFPTYSSQNCQDLFYYIPQPQPRCFSTNIWPFVSCRPYQQQFCGGCYSHYFDVTSSFYKYCPFTCYDDGYDIGPLYRPGPYYRPGYLHEPLCYQFGTCGINFMEKWGYYNLKQILFPPILPSAITEQMNKTQ